MTCGERGNSAAALKDPGAQWMVLAPALRLTFRRHQVRVIMRLFQQPSGDLLEMMTSVPAGQLRQSSSVVDAIMRPRSVAIVGVSAKPGSAGRVVLELLHNNKFAGPIHVVGRSTTDIEGHKVLASVDELPENVDLTVLTLPAAAVREAVEGCVRRKVKAAVIFASGFAEVGSDGNSEQDRIGAIARAGGLALVGPNCLGLMNFVDGFAAVFFSPQPIPRLPEGTRGAVAIVAQSGGLGNHLQAGLEARDVPVSCWISTGNEAGLGLADFIQYLLDDPVTQVIALYAEDIRRPQEFLDIAGEAMRRGKPIVMLHPGRGAKAKEAARSHTGALTGDHAAMRTLVERAGVVVVDNLDELMDVSEILARFPKPSKGDLGILTFSGAFCGIAHDFCEDIGVHLPPLSRETLEYLTPILPAFLPPKNPLDLGTQTIQQPELLQTCAEALLRDPAIGGLVISIPATSPRHSVIYIEGIAAASKTGNKPVALAILGDGSPLSPDFMAVVRKNKIVLSRSSDRTMRAMGKVLGYGNRNSALAAREPVSAAPIAIPELGAGAQPEWLGKKALAALGIAIPAGELARSVEAAVAVADRVGYPVAMKAQAAKLEHKTEAGGVMLGIANAEDVRRAWKTLHDNVERAQPGLKLDGVLVEAMSPRGLELVIGARRDPRWGPVVMVGLGGIWVEALGDVRLLPPDLSEAEIAGELRKLKTAKLLNGFRGLPPVDISAVAAAAAAVGRLMRAHPQILEIDINPLMVHAAGRGATALDALIITGGGAPQDH
jgi:acetate---CoA ligase (ADP-forming)